MISEGSCDTEDLNNHAENSALPLLEQITLENTIKWKIIILYCNHISHYNSFYSFFL